MISIYTKQEIIIRSYREGKSQRCLSRELQISRKMVRKYIEEYEKTLRSGVNAHESQSFYLSRAPEYKTRPRMKLRLTREVQGVIDLLLGANRQKLQQGLRKQLFKKKDNLEELHRQGFDIGYTTVCTYISNQSSCPVNKEAFVCQVYYPGGVCEFDRGEIKLWIGGTLMRLQLASNVYLKGLYRQHFYGEPRSFIDLQAYCRANKVSEEKLEESVKRLLSFGNGIQTTEKLRVLLDNCRNLNM